MVQTQLSRDAKQSRLQRIKNAIPAHLAIAVPVGLGVLLLLVRRRRNARRQQQRVQAVEAKGRVPVEGAILDIQLPTLDPRAPFVAFSPPKPLRVVMADVQLPGVALSALWHDVFSNQAHFLAAFHQARGDYDITITPWRQAEGSLGRRTLQYTSPLRNPLGPRQARNTEVMEVVELGASGFVLSTRCSTEGVPFAGNFANHLLWVALADGSGSSRLLITGECRFHNQVWGPLRGKIESESIKGMAKAYARFARMLQEEEGLRTGGGRGGGGMGSATASPAKPGLGGSSRGARAAGSGGPLALATPRTQLAAALGSSNPQQTATLVLVMVLCVMMYRLSLVDTVAVQLLRRMAGQYLPGGNQ